MKPFRTWLSCGCDRSRDLSCGCLERRVRVQYRIAPSGGELGLLFTDRADGRLAYYFRSIGLPFEGEPFAE